MSKIRNPLHFEIIPAPGALSSWEEIEKRIASVLPFAESVHIDINDGSFSDNKTWMDPAPFAKYTKEAIFEVHFMTDNPIQYVKSFADAGFSRFIGNVENMPDPVAFIAQTQLHGEAGLALDGPTPLSALDSVNLEDLDVVQLYTGESAGKSGAVMLPERLQKVMELRGRDAFLPIEIDGGVTDENILLAKEAGVTRFVTTGFLYTGNVEENYKKLQEKIT